MRPLKRCCQIQCRGRNHDFRSSSTPIPGDISTSAFAGNPRIDFDRHRPRICASQGRPLWSPWQLPGLNSKAPAPAFVQNPAWLFVVLVAWPSRPGAFRKDFTAPLNHCLQHHRTSTMPPAPAPQYHSWPSHGSTATSVRAMSLVGAFVSPGHHRHLRYFLRGPLSCRCWHPC